MSQSFRMKTRLNEKIATGKSTKCDNRVVAYVIGLTIRGLKI